MLELRRSCECCDKDLPPESTEARICSFECTFCASCADTVLGGKCPNCGGDHYESNRFNEALLQEIEREASLLRFDGRREEARALLRAIADVRIENGLRHAHFCLACGVQFDG